MSNTQPRVRVRTTDSPSHPVIIDQIRRVAPDAISLGTVRLRRHRRRQLAALAANISKFGFIIPLVVDAEGVLVSGHARLTVAKQLGMKEVPTISVAHLSPDEVRAFAIAENRMSELSEWDPDELKAELTLLAGADLNFDVELTGFDMGEIDLILGSGEDQAVEDSDDELVSSPRALTMTREGDIWISNDGKLKIICGDSRVEHTYQRLLGDERAALVVSDSPYNISIKNLVSGNGKAAHKEFHEASGEMSEGEFRVFLVDICRHSAGFSKDGALVFLFMDWRHIENLIWAGRQVLRTLLNVCVWRKTTGGMGGLYRSAHELCAVFKNGEAAHINNVQLGRFGRNRSNVWTHQGANTFRKGRDADLAAHPTVKPVQMIADIILDASNLNDLVLDAFLGSGTTLLAAHRTGRRGAGIEIDPAFVDVAVTRIQTATGLSFIHAGTGELFDDVAARRLAEGG